MRKGENKREGERKRVRDAAAAAAATGAGGGSSSTSGAVNFLLCCGMFKSFINSI